jgi:DNA repair protein RadC
MMRFAHLPKTAIELRGPTAAASYLMRSMRHLDRERLRALYLDDQNRLVGDLFVAQGRDDRVSWNLGDVVEQAPAGAAYLVYAHNHPSNSGLPCGVPSPEDMEVAARVITDLPRLPTKAGTILKFRDAMVIGQDGTYSTLNIPPGDEGNRWPAEAGASALARALPFALGKIG